MPNLPTSTAVRSPLVGRERELTILRARLAGAGSGRGGVALVCGEPGAGKTRLLDEIASEALAGGWTVLRGDASDVEGMPPYLPFLEALGRYIRRAGEEALRVQAWSGAATLAGIFPELVERLGEQPALYTLPPEQARLRLYEAASDFLAAIATAAPLLVVLDDLHWADGATLDLLLHVAVHQSDSRLLLLGAYRDDELDRNPALERTVAELSRRRLLSSITAGRLDEAALGELAGRQIGAPLDDVARRVLFAQSEGNPFFAEELLQEWVEGGALTPASPSDVWKLVRPVDAALPRGIVSAVRRRLARLAPATVECLRGAAIVGRGFEVELLAAVTAVDAETVEERLAEAVRARLLLAPAGGAGYRFSHDKIRECLYEETTATRRMRLHAAIGRELEGRGAGGARRLADLAFHFARSGDRERGIEYSLQAAADASRSYAAGEAYLHYEAALDLLGTSDPRFTEITLRQAEALVLAGRERDAVAAYETAEAAARIENSPFAAAAAYGAGRAWSRMEEHAAALRSYERALALAGTAPSALAVQVLTELAFLLVASMGRQTEGLAYGRRAQELARALGDRRLLVAANRTIGNLLARVNDLPGGIQLLEAALADALAIDDPVEAAECCASLVPAYYWAGEIHRSYAAARQRMELAHRCNDPYQLRHAFTALAVPLVMQGRWREAEAHIAEGRAHVELLASAEPLAFLRYVEGKLAYMRGDYAGAEAALGEAMATFRELGPATLVWYLGALCLAQLAVGKRQAAIESMLELEATLSAIQPGTIPTTHALDSLGLAAVLLGDARRVAGYASELAVFRGLCGNLVIDAVLGRLALYQGDRTRAEVYLAAAETQARREDLRPSLAVILSARAELALARRGSPDTAAARALFSEALALYEQLGHQPGAAEVRGRLAVLDGAARTRLPAGLSEREAEVLRLVAAGKSNREIGAGLSLSEKTVANHITAIFSKTGTDNRAGAAAYAIRHGVA